MQPGRLKLPVAYFENTYIIKNIFSNDREYDI